MSTLTTTYDDDILVVSLEDEQLDDQVHVAQLGSQLQELIPEARGKKVLLDLEKVSFMASVMVGQLFMLSKKCQAEQVTLKMCNVAAPICQVFELVRLINFVEILNDRDQARTAFSASQTEALAQAATEASDVRLAAQQGDAAAQFELGCCFENGSGVDQDMEEALNWYRKAAEQGHAGAQHWLGMAYAYGMNVPQDYDQAVQWYQRAAQQGHADAQYAMGMSYRYGVAGEEDQDEAAEWYRQAAAQGHEKAKEELDKIAAE